MLDDIPLGEDSRDFVSHRLAFGFCHLLLPHIAHLHVGLLRRSFLGAGSLGATDKVGLGAQLVVVLAFTGFTNDPGRPMFDHRDDDVGQIHFALRAPR